MEGGCPSSNIDDLPYRRETLARTVVGKGWIKTIDLKDGDRIASASGGDLAVLSLKPTGKNEKTYNLTVDGPHTFLVGEDRVVVHNTGPCGPLLKRIEKWLGSNLQFGRYGRNGENLRLESETSRFRLEHHEGKPHFHLDERNARGAWEAARGSPDHIFPGGGP